MDRNSAVENHQTDEIVALHPEGVDRNIIPGITVSLMRVALHPEGVDRNCAILITVSSSRVALHPEGVDRNPSL